MQMQTSSNNKADPRILLRHPRRATQEAPHRTPSRNLQMANHLRPLDLQPRDRSLPFRRLLRFRSLIPRIPALWMGHHFYQLGCGVRCLAIGFEGVGEVHCCVPVCFPQLEWNPTFGLGFGQGVLK
jgi:hypothetical protein